MINEALANFHREQLTHRPTSQLHSIGQPGEGHRTPDTTPDTLEERSEFTLLGSKQFNKKDIKVLIIVMWKLAIDL